MSAKRTIFAGVLMASLSASPWLRGQDVQVAAESSAVVRTARLSFFSGDLKVQRADNTGEDAAVPNMPLPSGTRLLTGESGLAEVEFEDGSVARITPHTALSLDALTLDAEHVAHTEISVLTGLAYFDLRQVVGATYTVYAAGVSVSPEENTAFRVSLAEGPATFAVFSGRLAAEEQDGFSATVKSGESLKANAEDNASYLLNQQVGQETFDSWNQSRDQAAADQGQSTTSAREDYAGVQGYGWSDLDANGAWYDLSTADGDQGEVWQPAGADAADFDPYGNGAFVWSGQGYVWASAYSWGWLPYRCGRWRLVPGWGWVWKPNRFCGVFGFGEDAGYGGVLIDIGSRKYKTIRRPIRGPGPFHPIIPVHRPEQLPSKPRAVAAPVKLADGVATPLPLVGPPAPASGFVVGAALYRDYPVEVGSRLPVLGVAARPGEQPSVVEGELLGWVPHTSEVKPPGTDAVRIYRAPIGVSAVRPAVTGTTAAHGGGSSGSHGSTAPAAPPASHSSAAAAPSSSSSTSSSKTK